MSPRSAAFAAPNPQLVFEAVKMADKGHGVLLLVLNHAGDMLCGNMVMKMVGKAGMNVRKVVTQEDISNAPRSANRRTLRYTVRIGRRRTNLFLECEAGEGAPIATRTLRWYVEVPEGMPLYRYFAE